MQDAVEAVADLRRQRTTTELLLIAALLTLFCIRFWTLGIVHTDDALWALWAYDPTVDPVGDFARTMGRLWAFPIGSLWLYGSAWNDTAYGNIIKVGGFVFFFVSFHALIWQCCGRRIAMLCATLVLGLNVIRWEESILTSVPFLSWGSAGLACISALTARNYLRNPSFLLLAATTLLFACSIVCNEGVSAFNALLVLWSIVWTSNFSLAQPTRRILLCCLAAIAVYATCAIGFRLAHPSTYGGVTLAPFDPWKIIVVTASFATSGSFWRDLLYPYSVVFADSLSETRITTNYSPFNFLSGLTRFPAPAAAGAIVAALMLSLCWRQPARRSSPRWSRTPEVFGAIVGLLLAVVPVLPVAMTVQYQQWFTELNVTSNSHSILCYFGVSLVAASAISALLRAIYPFKILAAVSAALLAISIGASAVVAARMSDAIVEDMRPEAARWRGFSLALDAFRVSKMSPLQILAPRFQSPGTWFAVVQYDYWSKLAKARYGVDLKFLDSSAVGDFPYYVLDHVYQQTTRSVVVFMARRTAPDGLVDQIVIRPENTSQRTLEKTWISYNSEGRFHQSRLSALPQLTGVSGAFVIADLSADPNSIRIADNSSIIFEDAAARAPVAVEKTQR